MSAIVIDGQALARSLQSQLKSDVEQYGATLPRPPGLAVVLVGDDPASKVYVGAKSKTAKNCGIRTKDVALPADIPQSELEAQLSKLNSDSDVDGVLLQLPLPKHLTELKSLLTISPAKDVDGLHPLNQGLLLRGAPAPRPCTPLGVMRLIDQARLQLGLSHNLSGELAVVIGRSILVGKPVATMLLERNCTVIATHSKTKLLRQQCSEADILIAAVGQPKLVTADWVKQGAIVIDVGINRTSEGKLCGDVDFESVLNVAGAVTPVPKGVGPMTITMLLSNTVDAWKTKFTAP